MVQSKASLESRLTRFLLRRLFGPLVTQVALRLLDIGPSYLPFIISQSRLSSRLVKEALVVLIHHRFVSWRPSEGLDNAPILYSLNIQMIYSRLAVGRLVIEVADVLGGQLVDIFLDVVTHGQRRQTFSHEPLLRAQFIMNVSFKEKSDGETMTKRTKTDSWVCVNYELLRVLYTSDYLRRSLHQDWHCLFPPLLKQHAPFTAHSQNMDKAKLDKLCFLVPWLHRQSHPTETFWVDHKALSAFVRDSVIISFLKGRFGQASSRIYAILLDRHFVEERQLLKHAMIPGKECRERLYALMNIGAVHLQEVPRTTDHAPSRTIFLWTTSKDSEWLRHLYRHAMVNLAERSVQEADRNAPLLSKTQRSDVKAGTASLDPLEVQQLQLHELQQARLLSGIDRLLTEYFLLIS